MENNPAVFYTIEQVPNALNKFIESYYSQATEDEKIKLAGILESWGNLRIEHERQMNIGSEKKIINQVHEMAIESLSPENYEKWLDVKAGLFVVRTELKD